MKEDVRWKFGTPPANNANYAWIQHFIHHLSPAGIAGFVMANGSMSTSTNSERDIRQAIIDADMVDCMVAMPGQLFYTTQIPVCLWFVTRSKKADNKRGYRDRTGQTLFIDARRMGTLVDRVHRELSEDDLETIAGVYHDWRNTVGANPSVRPYEDKASWWKSAPLDDIKGHGYALTPGRYVGAEEVEDNGIPLEEKMKELSAELYGQFAKAEKLESKIKTNLELLGFGE